MTAKYAKKFFSCARFTWIFVFISFYTLTCCFDIFLFYSYNSRTKWCVRKTKQHQIDSKKCDMMDVNKSSLIIVLSRCNFPFLAKFISPKPTTANITKQDRHRHANHSKKVKKKHIDWKIVYSWLAFMKSVFYGFNIIHSQKKCTSRQWMRHTESEIF